MTDPMEGPWVFLPGMNCSARLWSEVAPRGSLAPELEESTLDGQVQRLLAELPSRFRLAGLSLGGIVAMALVSTAPERVTRLCLMSTNPSAPTEPQRDGWRALRAQLASGRTARQIQQDLLPVLLSPTAQADPVQTDLTLQLADDVGDERFARQLHLQDSRVDLWPTLSAIACPTRLVAARDDALCAVSKHQEMNRAIPQSSLVIIPDCGHLSPIERPGQIAAALAF